MKDYLIPLAKPHIDKDDIAGIVRVLKSGHLSLGPVLSRFEEEFAFYTGAKYACAVSSGTAGLHLAIRALGIKSDDEVITTPFSFIASSNCILYEGAKPVFVDIEETTFNINTEKIESAITQNTKAILIVHIFGQPANMGRIMKLARKYKLVVIEDACESVGAKYKNRFTGTFGGIGVFAFYPNKQMTTGEGGMLVANSKKTHELCLALRNQGRVGKMSTISHQMLGYNYRMDEMSAALGLSQLMKVNLFIQERTRIARWYSQYLSDLPNVIVPNTAIDRTHSWFVYVIRITNGKRDVLQRVLEQEGVQTKAYLPTIHLQPFMMERFGYRRGDFPVAEKVSSQTLALPLFVGLKKQDVNKIVRIIKKNI